MWCTYCTWDEKVILMKQNHPWLASWFLGWYGCIHSKRWFSWLQNFADNLNFPQKDCLRTRKVSRLHCLQSYWRSFPLFMLSHCNKLSIKTLTHTILSTKMPHWHQILVIFIIYALLSRNFVVAIYALFPQNFGDWKSGFADWVTFRMYADCPCSR